jgi:hypothetical protein
MANPTTNFGWVMPSATDLVTDLPADFDVFGQAVDTDFIGLKGGTTGQVLAKASGTDLDFVWSADAAGMTNPMTTTADIIYSSSGSTPARLGIGSAGDLLTVDGSGVPTWSAPASAGALTLITTATASGTATTLSIDSCFSATYTSYLILSVMKTAVESGFSCKLRASSTDSSTAYYYSGFYNSSSSSTLQATAGANAGSFLLRDIGTEQGLHTLSVANPFNAIDTSILMTGMQGWAGSNTENVNLNGAHHVSTSYDGISFISSSGNLTGTVRVYGYSNS